MTDPTPTPGSATDGRVIADGDTRKHTYDLVIAVVLLLAGVGVVAPEHVQLWLNLAAPLVALGAVLLARLNVPRKPGAHARE